MTENLEKETIWKISKTSYGTKLDIVEKYPLVTADDELTALQKENKELKERIATFEFQCCRYRNVIDHYYPYTKHADLVLCAAWCGSVWNSKQCMRDAGGSFCSGLRHIICTYCAQQSEVEKKPIICVSCPKSSNQTWFPKTREQTETEAQIDSDSDNDSNKSGENSETNE